MICDIRTRLWTSAQTLGEEVAAHLRRRRSEPWETLPAGVEAFDRAMQTVDQAILHGFESALLGAAIPPEQVADHVARVPGHYLGFAGIDPTQPGALAKLDRAVELGLVGVTVSPSGQGFHPCHSDAMTLFEACAQRSLPVFIEPMGTVAGPARLEFDRPSLLDEVARDLPGLKLVLGGLADPFIDEGLALLAKHPQVFADLSALVQRPWRLYNALVNARERGAIDQLLFGSGFPFCEPEQAIVTLYSVNGIAQGTPLPSVPRELLRTIVQRDALSMLGLPYREPRRRGKHTAIEPPPRMVEMVQETPR